MDYKKSNYTLVYYEYPAAKHELWNWEVLKQKQIIAKLDFGHYVFYVVRIDDEKVEYDYEILICTPVENLLDETTVIDVSKEMLLNNFYIGEKFELEYRKTLLFGNIEPEQFQSIKEHIWKVQQQMRKLNEQSV